MDLFKLLEQVWDKYAKELWCSRGVDKEECLMIASVGEVGLSQMCLTGDQEVAGLIPQSPATFFCGD